jgi:hypothetical protein
MKHPKYLGLICSLWLIINLEITYPWSRYGMKFFTVTISHIEIRMYHLQKLLDRTFVEVKFTFISLFLTVFLRTLIKLYFCLIITLGDRGINRGRNWTLLEILHQTVANNMQHYQFRTVSTAFKKFY